MLALKEESSDDLLQEKGEHEGQYSSNEDQFESNEEQCETNEEQCRDNEEQCGDNEEQCGSNEEQCGSNEEQCGSNEEQFGSSEEQFGSDEGRLMEMKDIDSCSRTEDCKDDKENIEENGDCGNDGQEHVLAPKICERTGVKRKFDDCDFSEEVNICCATREKSPMKNLLTTSRSNTSHFHCANV